MCLDDLEKATERVERLEFCETQVEKPPEFAKSTMEIVCEDTVITDFKQNSQIMSFEPRIRSGEWSDIGSRQYMEDTHVCIYDLAKNYGYDSIVEETISFYGVFDGHGGKDAAHFVRDNLPRVIVEDADFPLDLEKVVRRSFVQTDTQFAKTCSLQSALPSGTTALTAMIFGRSLLVANAGDCRAVLSRYGSAIEMSQDHRPCCTHELKRVESLGGYVDDGYLNGLLAVTRALGDWHLEGMKNQNQVDSTDGPSPGPLSAEPELKLISLTKEDEFLIIASDGIWDVFSNQNAVDFVRRRLQEHNDVKLCCKEFVEEAIRRNATDNVTAVLICFHLEPLPLLRAHRSGRVMRSISAEGLHSLRLLLEGK
ncbi:Protein phosphatase 2C family protein [Rhynchospora pubera]|uniref:protein-serine/threonine phosphatase n=1 Tax=Rhynchospora pubera TaxID=906938 RepID=A0AAV8FHR5_9POAL|nr:Protein phosphatase 2C family protein [Rhynchospora pubera]